jgi:acyl-CoA dehydrogenase
MDFALDREDQEIKERARAFAEEVLFPLELECEENEGIADDAKAEVGREVLARNLNAFNQAKDVGGQGYTVLQQMLAQEELGKATGCLWTLVWHPASCLRLGSPEQIETYLKPSCVGKRRGCFAITEPGAGSDPRQVRTSAVKRGGKYVINGEKWFVTSYDACDYMIVHVHVDGDPDKPTLFLVDKDQPGVRAKRYPKFTHTFVFEHAEVLFEDVEVGEEHMLGTIGEGFELTKDWFIEARLDIAARCVGAATRAAQIATDWAAEREQFGRPIRDYQGVEFMLADMAVDIMASKSLLYRVAWEADREVNAKLVHARASAVKLHASEMVGRVVDKAVQVLGGRGYMRENPVERLYREMRVERIWEGTSEIQRSIIGGQIKKRGLDVYTGWVSGHGN